MAPYLKTLVDSVQYFVQNFEHQRARAVCYWAHCGRGAQRYADLKQAIEVLGEDVTDAERAWYEKMKTAKQSGCGAIVGRPSLKQGAMVGRPSRKTGLQNLGVENGF